MFRLCRLLVSLNFCSRSNLLLGGRPSDSSPPRRRIFLQQQQQHHQQELMRRLHANFNSTARGSLYTEEVIAPSLDRFVPIAGGSLFLLAPYFCLDIPLFPRYARLPWQFITTTMTLYCMNLLAMPIKPPRPPPVEPPEEPPCIYIFRAILAALSTALCLLPLCTLPWALCWSNSLAACPIAIPINAFWPPPPDWLWLPPPWLSIFMACIAAAPPIPPDVAWPPPLPWLP